MSTIIKYQNDIENFITEQQANQLSDFSKLYYENNILKKEETYINNQLEGGVYYLSPDENINEVLTNLGVHLNWAIMSNEQIINGYKVFELRGYNENFQNDPEYSKVVYDYENRVIATVAFDSQTHLTKGAYKAFYFGGMHVPWDDDDIFFEEDARVIFSFDTNGSIENISMNVDIINNESNWISLNKFLIDGAFFIENMMPSNKLDYFTNVEPIVPDF
jgi:hypothetical protein